MSRPPRTHPRPAHSTRRTGLDVVRADLLDVSVDGQKRIDHYIDYFGVGGPRRTIVPSGPGGTSRPDENGARVSTRVACVPDS